MLNFVNVHGAPWSPRNAAAPKKTKTPEMTSFHKGWKVVGLPPGSQEEAAKEHTKQQLGKPEPKPFNLEQWLMTAKSKPVRSKPYGVPDAAHICAEMAKKSGWLRVEVVEIKQETNSKKG